MRMRWIDDVWRKPYANEVRPSSRRIAEQDGRQWTRLCRIFLPLQFLGRTEHLAKITRLSGYRRRQRSCQDECQVELPPTRKHVATSVLVLIAFAKPSDLNGHKQRSLTDDPAGTILRSLSRLPYRACSSTLNPAGSASSPWELETPR